ncbi:MAG: radical SAM protein [Planctomycetes bacterium]|nr:radical SAM protein [Planctomycetota bacterium]
MTKNHKHYTSGQNGSPKKVMLLFPPDWFPSEPYLSLPTLTAFLRRAGHEVFQKDINLEMYDWFFSRDFLYHVLRRVPSQLKRLKDLSNVRKLNDKELSLEQSLQKCTRSQIDEVAIKVETAKTIVRSQKFYDVDKLEWAIHAFHEVTALISLVYYPAQISMPPKETDLTYQFFISSEVLEAVKDSQVNVYRDVFRHLLMPAIEARKPDVIGISIVMRQQIFSSMTFCSMIKEQYPHIHVTIGGNTVTRLRDVLPQTSNLFSLFDTAVLFEGETALLKLVDSIDTGQDFSTIPNIIYKDGAGIHTSPVTSAEDVQSLPPPDFDGLLLRKYFVPDLILPYLSTRGCYWGKCEFCDHGEGYTAGYRTRNIDRIIEDIRYLRDRYQAVNFHFIDESYPPSLFKQLTRRLIDVNLQISWTTHLRFEKSLLSDKVWDDARRSGLRFLHMGFESGSERVLKLMGKATTTDIIQQNLALSSGHGVWNHVMGFFGFPGETREDAKSSMSFLEDNKEHIHSIGFGTFDLGKYTPVMKNRERFGVTVHKNPEWDLALDYYFTVKEGLGIEEAEEVFSEFERTHYEGWDLKIFIREYIFLYVAHFGTNKIPFIRYPH